MYYKKKATKNQDADLMNEIRDIYERYPFFGYRKIHAVLVQKGHAVNRKKVQRLMCKEELYAVCPKKRTTVRNKNHAIYPYLLRNMNIDHPNQVWQVDITYIKIRGGFIYLICLIDVYSRKIMGWNISTFLDTAACINAFENALTEAKPEIINSDQGCQFTSEHWCKMLLSENIRISMDGIGRWADNIYIERLWRTIKYESVYLHRFETVKEARDIITQYIEFYNTERPHQALGYKNPSQVYEGLNNALAQKKQFGEVPSSLCTQNSQIFTQKMS